MKGYTISLCQNIESFNKQLVIPQQKMLLITNDHARLCSFKNNTTFHDHCSLVTISAVHIQLPDNARQKIWNSYSMMKSFVILGILQGLKFHTLRNLLRGKFQYSIFNVQKHRKKIQQNLVITHLGNTEIVHYCGAQHYFTSHFLIKIESCSSKKYALM